MADNETEKSLKAPEGPKASLTGDTADEEESKISDESTPYQTTQTQAQAQTQQIHEPQQPHEQKHEQQTQPTVDDDNDDESDHHRRWYHCRCNLRRWPRTIACCLGVFIPLQFIVIVSLVLGLLLGKLEMSQEIESNDAYVRQRTTAARMSNDLVRTLHQLPTLCLTLYLDGETEQSLPETLKAITSDPSLLKLYLNTSEFDNTSPTTQQQPEVLLRSDNRTIQDMSDFFATCAEVGAVYRDELLNTFKEPLINEGTPLSFSFNYIRCVNRSSPLAFNAIILPTEQDMYEAFPTTQAQLYEQSWIQNQQELELEYSTEENLTKIEATAKSYQDATGSQKCAVNMPSGAWFWFTVMSTVGYGNQVPRSVWGRCMTYTLGFFSILLFGGVLATAGGITTHLLNDTVHRFKRVIARPVKVLIWGILWSLWMVLIAWQARSYQATRLDSEMASNDAYWFAFISTTTIGFGDYYLQPEGLFISDLLGLWINFLIGFVLLSSFLTELSQLLGSVVPDVSAYLQRKLKYAYEEENGLPEEVLRSSRRKKSAVDQEERFTSHPILRNQTSFHGPNFIDPSMDFEEEYQADKKKLKQQQEQEEKDRAAIAEAEAIAAAFVAQDDSKEAVQKELSKQPEQPQPQSQPQQEDQVVDKKTRRRRTQRNPPHQQTRKCLHQCPNGKEN